MYTEKAKNTKVIKPVHILNLKTKPCLIIKFVYLKAAMITKEILFVLVMYAVFTSRCSILKKEEFLI